MPRSGNNISEGQQGSNSSRPARKKISREIFDPADHDQPSRKRRVPSPDPNGVPQESNGGQDQRLSQGTSQNIDGAIKTESTCVVCFSAVGNPKRGTCESLIKCFDCQKSFHLSCLDYTEDLTKKVMSMQWQCQDCKTCHICNQDNDSGTMLICDSCDLGFHMDCHKPPLARAPSGRWECFKCVPRSAQSMPPPPSGQAKSRTPNRLEGQPGAAMAVRVTHSAGQDVITDGLRVKGGEDSHAPSKEGSPGKDQATTRFLPILPPHCHPHTGFLPENWEDYEPDPNIPDVSGWDSAKIRDYFADNGFPPNVCQTFIDQEIDGGSLLLLHRNDVLTSLDLKLGPAIKVFNHVKKLQTRRHFPNM